MTRRLPSLSSVRAFEAAGRRLSFTGAAEELNVTQGAVSRQVRALEEYLGVRLFRRAARSVVLTAEGEEYLRAVRESFDRLEQATLRILGRPESRVLTLNVLPTLASRWVIPRLLSFTEPNTPIEVRMITSIAPVDFGRDDIDVAIRVGSPHGQVVEPGRARIDLVMTDDWRGVSADFLFPDVIVPVASRGLLASGRPLATPGVPGEPGAAPDGHAAARVGRPARGGRGRRGTVDAPAGVL
ncbi:MAG TPA: LysR family transcriptional regulator [Thermodesulfobacteriota bacterium]